MILFNECEKIRLAAISMMKFIPLIRNVFSISNVINFIFTVEGFHLFIMKFNKHEINMNYERNSFSLMTPQTLARDV